MNATPPMTPPTTGIAFVFPLEDISAPAEDSAGAAEAVVGEAIAELNVVVSMATVEDVSLGLTSLWATTVLELLVLVDIVAGVVDTDGGEDVVIGAADGTAAEDEDSITGATDVVVGREAGGVEDAAGVVSTGAGTSSGVVLVGAAAVGGI
jgi:hypothetical protein